MSEDCKNGLSEACLFQVVVFLFFVYLICFVVRLELTSRADVALFRVIPLKSTTPEMSRVVKAEQESRLAPVLGVITVDTACHYYCSFAVKD